MVNVLCGFFSIWCIPCGVAAAGMNWGFLASWQSLCLVPFIAAASLTVASLPRFWTDRRYRFLQRRLARRLQDEQVETLAWDGQFIQFAPAGELRLYDLHTEWDVGFLFLLNDRLTYLGEQTRFSIPRSDIQRVTIGYGSIELPLPYQTRIHWSNRSKNEFETISVWPGVSDKILDLQRRSLVFAQKVRDWQIAGTAARELPKWADLSTLSLEGVNSKSVDEAVPLAGQVFGGILSAFGMAFTTVVLGIMIDAPPGWWPITSALTFLVVILYYVGIRLFVRWHVPELPANPRNDDQPTLNS